jgi:hypothetical protein
MRSGRGSRRPTGTWWLAFAGFFLVAAGWAVALPIHANTDEYAHVERAYGVDTGQILTTLTHGVLNRPSMRQQVPRSLVPLNPECGYHPVARSLACVTWSPSRAPIVEQTWVGRYDPVYYAPVGLPIVLNPTLTGVYLGRLVSAAWSAILLAASLTLALRVRARVLALGVLLAATPTALNLAAAINPNGLEITSGIAWWTAVLVALRAQAAQDDRSRGLALNLAVGAGGLLLTLRALGTVWFALSLAALAALAGRREGARLLRAAGRGRIAALITSGLGGLAWNAAADNYAYYKQTNVTPSVLRMGGLTDLRQILAGNLDHWLCEVVGTAGQADTTAQVWVCLLWYGPVLGLVLLAALGGRGREAWIAPAVGAAALLITVGLEIKEVGLVGWAQNGRYFLPLFVGMVLVAAAVVQRGRFLGEPMQGRLLRICATAATFCQVWWLGFVMSRMQNGPIVAFNPLRGAWLPITGPEPPLLACLAGMALLGLLVVRGRPARSRPDRVVPRPLASRDSVSPLV